MYHYAYIIADFILFIPWLVMFLYRKDLRREMITMGLLSGVWLVASGIWFYNIYIDTYWRPEFAGFLHINKLTSLIGLKAGGVEDVLFLFFITGIAAAFYEEFFHRTHTNKIYRKSSYYFLFPFIIFLSFSIITITRKFNIIYGEYLAYFISAAIVWFKRHDLFLHSIATALFLSIFFFLFYIFVFLRLFPGIIHAWWIVENGSGILIQGVPLEELIWAFSYGLFIAPMYEFLHGLKDRKLPKN